MNYEKVYLRKDHADNEYILPQYMVDKFDDALGQIRNEISYPLRLRLENEFRENFNHYRKRWHTVQFWVAESEVEPPSVMGGV